MDPTNKTTAADLLQQGQDRVGLDDEAVAAAVGYTPAVVVMLRSGVMRLPVNKVSAFAKTLQIDRTVLLKAVLGEAGSDLWEAIAPLLPLGELSETEVNLVRHLRRLGAGRDARPIVIDGAGVIALVVTP
jgi:hypothetical protein